MHAFDHLILGTGQALGTLLGGLLPSGESICVVEGGKIGGTCVNVGCTPTKTLVASARVAHMIRRGPEFGMHTSDLRINFSEVMARVNAIRSGSNTGIENWLESEKNVTLFKGWAEFKNSNSVIVGDEQLTGKNIYINVGARARIPETPGLDEVAWLDNRSLLDIHEIPEHLIIVGGSYIGLEFGQIFRRFGSRVTVIQRGSQLVSREDEDVAQSVEDVLTGEGISVLLGAGFTSVSRQSDNEIAVSIEQAGSQKTLVGSHLLLATGRIPNSDRLNVAAAGIETDARGYVQVDDYCRTNVDHIFALGDVNGHGAFTHTSVNDAEIVLDLRRGGTRKLSDRISAYALFIDPALGRVGMTEKEALSKGHQVLKATRPMSRISRAKEMGETQGFAKLLVDAETDLILGAAIHGPGGDEIINMFAAYMYGGLPCRSYRRSVLVHPTISELMPWILDNLKPVN